MLLCAENVNQDNLLSYAREAADFATNYQLPSLDFAMNHYGQPDVAMFDFTSMYASENAALVRERQAHRLLVALVGDSLLEVSAMCLEPPCSCERDPCMCAGAHRQGQDGFSASWHDSGPGARPPACLPFHGIWGQLPTCVQAGELSLPPLGFPAPLSTE